MLDYLCSFAPEVHFHAFILGSTRLMVFAMVAPFMGNNVLGLTARSAVVLALYTVIHPTMLGELAALSPSLLTSGFLIIKEILIGFFIGWLAGMIFWAVESAGFFIDNQRGAGMASETDPLSGDQSSPTGSFLSKARPMSSSRRGPSSPSSDSSTARTKSGP